jgi:membrane-associated phospholipid phosphatase
VKNIFKTNSYFFVPYFFFLIVGAAILFLNPKPDTQLEFNSLHSNFFDHFFYFVTFLGDGILALLITIILLFYSFRSAFIVGISNILASSFTQVLKHFVFNDHVRPKKYFEGISNLYFVPGVENYLYNSFPSGHSTCAFSLYLALCFLVKSNLLKLLFFVIAILVGYSRIYLSQHFLEDVYVGSIIGVCFTIIIYYFLEKSKNLWMNKSISNML